MKGLIGKKIGMTQIFDDNGKAIPVTVIVAGPCTVTQVKTLDRDGYDALQLGIEELKKGKNYYILFTTSGGLYRYNLNDIVKVVGWHNSTPLLEFLYKGGNVCSFTGEKLTEPQVIEAIRNTTEAAELKVNFFTVIPEFQPNPHYQLWIEFDHYPLEETVKLLARNVDRAIGKNNCEYESKRESGRLDPITIHLLKPGTYRELRKALVDEGIPDAQIKIPHLNPKAEVKKKLLGQLLIRVRS